MTFRNTTFKALASTLIIAASALLQAGEPIRIDYHFEGNTSVNLSAMIGGPLSINTFTDGREDNKSNKITRHDAEALTISNITPAELVQLAFEQAISASGAKLSEGTASLSLDGKLIEMQVVPNEGGLQVLIRCELTLRNQSRNAWQSVLFSQIRTEGTNVETALALGLNRLVSELFMDDYFLMELGIF